MLKRCITINADGGGQCCPMRYGFSYKRDDGTEFKSEFSDNPSIPFSELKDVKAGEDVSLFAFREEFPEVGLERSNMAAAKVKMTDWLKAMMPVEVRKSKDGKTITEILKNGDAIVTTTDPDRHRIKKRNDIKASSGYEGWAEQSPVKISQVKSDPEKRKVTLDAYGGSGDGIMLYGYTVELPGERLPVGELPKEWATIPELSFDAIEKMDPNATIHFFAMRQCDERLLLKYAPPAETKVLVRDLLPRKITQSKGTKVNMPKQEGFQLAR